jgi:nitrous oxidase accessory protein
MKLISSNCAMQCLLSIILFLLPAMMVAANIHVGKDLEIKSINDAILSSNSGDTITVHEGLYTEKGIKLIKQLTLIGINLPVLDGEHEYEILTIGADGVHVSGFKFVNSGQGVLNDLAAVKVIESSFVTITTNIFENNIFAIYLQNCTHCEVHKNKIKSLKNYEQSTGNGIHCWKSDSLKIVANSIEGHRDGIYFEFVTGSIIWRNVSSDNLRYGLHFMFSHHDTYIGNVFRNNGSGVAVMYTNHVCMMNNTFDESWGDAAFGLLLKEISDSYISGNTFNSNTCGILMEGSSRIKMERNLFNQNGWGMRVQASCIENEIIRNDFIANTFDICTNGSLVLNSFEGNYWDKYEGYDLDKNQIGDIPFHPLSLFGVIAEKNPPVMLLFRSFFAALIDRTEKLLPTLTPDNFVDNTPSMKRILS